MSDPDGSGSEPDATGEPDDDAPLADLARRVGRERRDDDRASADLDADLSEEPPPDPDDDPFDRMSVGEVDEEALWSSLGSDDSVGVGVDAGVDASTAADADSAADADAGSLGDDAAGPSAPAGAAPGAREHVVPKSDYCQSCPYLDAPPELACTHEGTEIVEVVDNERFRVRNCPMVDDGVDAGE
jgi:hypothetical protein